MSFSSETNNSKKLASIPLKQGITINSYDNIDVKKEKIIASSEDFILPSMIFIDKNDNVYSLSDDINFSIIINNPSTFLDDSSKDFINYYNLLKNRYKSLEKSDLISLIEAKIDEIIPGVVDVFSIENYKEKIRILKEEYISKHSFTTKDIPQKDIDFYINKNGYSILSSINFIHLESEYPLDIKKILKEVKLSELIPLVYTIDDDTYEPIVKVHKSVNEKQLREWLLKGKIKENFIPLKRAKGVIFKVKKDTESTEYFNVSLNKNSPRLTLRCNWNNYDNAKFEDIKKCIKNIEPLISQIQKISRLPSNYQIETSYTKIYILTNVAVKIKKNLLRMSTISKNLKIDNIEKTSLNMTHIPSKSTILIKNTDLSTMSIQISGIRKEGVVLDVIKEIINAISHLPQIDKKDLSKNKNNDDGLKNKGVIINKTECQKFRLPTSEENSKSRDSPYSILYNNVKLYCTKNPEYPYPGFTTKNTPCCFKKDQREKTIFKINNNESLQEKILSDENILEMPILGPNKFLQPYRLGKIPKNIQPYFDSSVFFRLGVSQKNNDTFLNGVNMILKTNISRDKITISEDDYNTLENGEIKNKFINKEDYTKFIKKSKSSEYIIDLLSSFIKKNIIVINDSDIVCSSYSNLEFSEYIIFIKNSEKNYEILSKKINDKNLKKFFVFDDVKEFIRLYDKSCQVKYISKHITPLSFSELKAITIGQILNPYGKVIFIKTDESFILPVIPRTKIRGIPVVNIEDTIRSPLSTLRYTEKLKMLPYEVVSQLIYNKEGKQLVSGLMTKSGIIIPTKNGALLKDIEIAEDIMYIKNLEDNISSYPGTQTKLSKKITEKLVNREFYQRFRYTLSNNISLIKQKILEIKNDKDQNFNQKITNISSIIKTLLDKEVITGDHEVNQYKRNIPDVRNLCSKLSDNCSRLDPFCAYSTVCRLYCPKYIYKDIIQKLTIEILNDKEILEGEVSDYSYNSVTSNKDYVKRKTEVILLTREELINYFKNK